MASPLVRNILGVVCITCLLCGIILISTPTGSQNGQIVSTDTVVHVIEDNSSDKDIPSVRLVTQVLVSCPCCTIERI